MLVDKGIAYKSAVLKTSVKCFKALAAFSKNV